MAIIRKDKKEWLKLLLVIQRRELARLVAKEPRSVQDSKDIYETRKDILNTVQLLAEYAA